MACFITAWARDGSSPLARGLLLMSGMMRSAVRIIPARAGFTPDEWDDEIRRADHPRSRGVYYNEIGLESVDMGSSPLARGLPEVFVDLIHGPGIIPARAGFTSKGDQESSGRRDHPRSRGVYSPSSRRWMGAGGSSPLARGLPVSDSVELFGARIIPARAGFTSPCTSTTARSADHPRSRGVYSAAK